MSVSLKRKISIGLLFIDVLLVMYMFFVCAIPEYIVTGGDIINFLLLMTLFGVSGILLLFKTIEDDKIKYYIMNIVAKVIFVVYMALLIYEMVVSRLSYLDLKVNYDFNLIPFKGMFGMISQVIHKELNTGIMVENLIGNFIMFMPMVILLDLVFKKIKKKSHCVFISIGICVILELIQCFTLVGAFDIDDVILNTLGMLVSYLIIKMSIYARIKEKLYL